MKTPQKPHIVSVFVPFKLTKRGGRKEMILPPANELNRPRPDNTVLKALARAFRWKRMLEDGSYASITELAEKEKIGMSYLTRVMRMTLLAPDIIDAILEGRQGEGIDLTVLAAPFPLEWGAQRRHFSSQRTDS
jgi:hypothetical protein